MQSFNGARDHGWSHSLLVRDLPKPPDRWLLGGKGGDGSRVEDLLCRDGLSKPLAPGDGETARKRGAWRLMAMAVAVAVAAVGRVAADLK